MNRIKQLWEQKPLPLILWLAAITRMVAVIFSKGYGWHDDHFLVVEIAQSWVDKNDFYSWLPWNGNAAPSGHSFFYPGLHFVLFSLLKLIHIIDPETKMYIVRFLNALWSMVLVYCGYHITERLSNKEYAKKVGLLLAIVWFMPFMAVRDLVEFACIPFLAAAILIIMKQETEKKAGWLFFAGMMIGFSMNTRFQTSMFFAGLCLALLIKGQWKALILTGLGAAFVFIGFQEIIDLHFWGKPFAEFLGYYKYNVDNAYNYVNNPWYTYLILILGLLIPPVSILWGFGFLRNYKNTLIVFLPVVVFIFFHSIFPNKQERFILPVIPFIIMTGVPGWGEFVKKSKYWLNHPKLLRGFYIFFWTVNTILLVLFMFTYTKKARVESALYLSKYPHIHSLVMESSHTQSATQIPMFYLNQWVPVYSVTGDNTPDKFAGQMDAYRKNNIPLPDFILFAEDINLENRVAFMKKIFPNLKYKTEVTPSLVDIVFYKMNKVNRNPPIYIYSTQ